MSQQVNAAVTNKTLSCCRYFPLLQGLFYICWIKDEQKEEGKNKNKMKQDSIPCIIIDSTCHVRTSSCEESRKKRKGFCANSRNYEK